MTEINSIRHRAVGTSGVFLRQHCRALTAPLALKGPRPILQYTARKGKTAKNRVPHRTARKPLTAQPGLMPYRTALQKNRRTASAVMSPKSIKCRTAAPPHSRSIKCRTAVPPHRRIQHKIRDPSFFSAWVFGGSLNSDPSRASWLVPGWFLVSFWVQVMTKKHSQGILWVARADFRGWSDFGTPFLGKCASILMCCIIRSGSEFETGRSR